MPRSARQRWPGVLLVIIKFVVKWFASAALSEESSHTHVGQSLVHKREIGSFVTTLSSAYYYDHQAGGLPDDRSKT